MTLNIGGGFSFERCASSIVSSFCCAMPPRVRPVPPENLTSAGSAQFLGPWYAIGGVGATRRGVPIGRITVPFHGLAREQQPAGEPLTTSGAARKRRAVFGFRLSVSPVRGGVGEFRHGPGRVPELKPTSSNKGRAHGNRHGEVVQRREGLRLHHAR